MSSRAVEHLASELDSLIKRYCTEYDINYAEAIGVLQMKIVLLVMESEEGFGDDDDWGKDATDG